MGLILPSLSKNILRIFLRKLAAMCTILATQAGMLIRYSIVVALESQTAWRLQFLGLRVLSSYLYIVVLLNLQGCDRLLVDRELRNLKDFSSPEGWRANCFLMRSDHKQNQMSSKFGRSNVLMGCHLFLQPMGVASIFSGLEGFRLPASVTVMMKWTVAWLKAHKSRC